MSVNVTAADYEIHLPGEGIDEVRARLDTLLAADRLEVPRRTKQRRRRARPPIGWST